MRHAALPPARPHELARGHALHSFLVGLVVDVAVAAGLFVAQAVGGVSDRASLALFALALTKTVLATAGSYVARRLAAEAAGQTTEALTTGVGSGPQ